MTTPVSFEVAKLLKEKRFDRVWDNSVFYTKGYPDSFPLNLFITKEDYLSNKEQYQNHYVAPTIVEVIIWLYEKHGIWIYADSHEFGKWCYNYKYNRPHLLNPKVTENGQFGLNDYNSPTEAYEAAIEYTLNNLI